MVHDYNCYVHGGKPQEIKGLLRKITPIYEKFS